MSHPPSSAPHKRITLLNLCGLHSGFQLDKEQNTLALIGSDDVLILAFQTDAALQDCVNSIRSLVDLGDCFDMFMAETPKPYKKLSAHFVKLYMLGDYLVVISLTPVRHVTAWRLTNLNEFGLKDGDRFYLRGIPLNGKEVGQFVFQSTSSVDLVRAMTNRRSEMCDGSTASSGGADSHCTATSNIGLRLAQNLTFYEDFYLRNMRRGSVASVNSRGSNGNLSDTFNVESPKRNSMNTAKSLVTCPKRHVPHIQQVRMENNSCGVYDVPPSRHIITGRSKCGIYDVPPRRLGAVAPLTQKSQVDSRPSDLYDHLPMPRRISSPSISSQLIVTAQKCSKADASPKSKADYNSVLKYVDLSRYDGCSPSAIGQQLIVTRNQRSCNRSMSLDADCVYDTPPPRPKRTDLHGDHQNYQNVIARRKPAPPPPPPDYDILPPADLHRHKKQLSIPVQSQSLDNVESEKKATPPTNLGQMKRLAKSADNLQVLGTQRLSLATKPLELPSPSANADLADDGYVLVSEQAIAPPNPSQCNNVKMRANTRRQHSLDITACSGWRCSSDSGRMTSSNNSLSSRRRESNSSFSGGSHLSLSSPNRLRMPHAPTSPKGPGYRSCSTDCSKPLCERSLRSRTISETSSEGCATASSSCVTSDINYADLELELTPSPRPMAKCPTFEATAKASIPEGAMTSSSESKKSDIEYVMINIMATEALHKASEEHNQYRNRRSQCDAIKCKGRTTPISTQ